MPGLMPGIHVARYPNKTWMAGSSPAMTHIDQLWLGFAAATALIGTSVKPRVSAAFAHAAMRSIDAGSADAMPTAMPRSFANASRRESARSMLSGVGTEGREAQAE